MPDPAFPDRFFEREDEAPDSVFYREPRFVAHIDDDTIAALTAYYREFLPPGSRVLDLMSSWISHLPEIDYACVAGLGMNGRELAANPRLTDHAVHDLNVDPKLPYPDGAFDRALIAVSIQYLVRPLDVFRDLCRVLSPGARVAISMSHRCFPTKAIMAFRALGPSDRVRLVSTYLHHAGFVDIAAEDRSPAAADPLWIVVGTRAESGSKPPPTEPTLAIRTRMSEHAPVKGKEFIDRVTELGRRRNVPVRVDAKRGKGSHVILYYGDRKTVVKDRRKDIGPGLLAAMTRQLGLDPGDLG